jgi:hypothetical protein
MQDCLILDGGTVYKSTLLDIPEEQKPHKSTLAYSQLRSIASTIYHIFFYPMPSHVRYGLHGLPSRLWPKCNRLLRLGRP